MKTKLYMRIWSALLVLLLVLECLPLGAVRAELTDPTQETEAAAETVAVTEATEPSETAEATAETEPVDNCPYCQETTAEDGTVIHALNCNAQYAYDGTADVGRYVQLILEIAENGVEVSSNHSSEDSLYFYYEEFGADTVMRITDWYWDAGTTGLWYQVELYSGSFPESTEDYTWPDPTWILQDYTDTTYEYDAALEFVTVELPDTGCDICGKEDCTSLHFWCDYCNGYDCGKAHLICRACGEVDCEKEHIFCGYCNGYDCGLSHDQKPAAAPVIPENPTLTDGTDVTVVDGNGDAVTGEFILFEGMKSSLSAWTELEGDVSYQWQVCVDGQWINIQGQTGKGILVSPAMFLSLSSAAIRCVVTSGDQTLTGEEISVVIMEQPETASFAMDSHMAALAAEDNSEDLQKAYVVVQYVYADGRTASAADFAEIVPGNKYSHNYTLPTIPGYKATLNTHSYGDSAVLSGNTLTMNFAENVLTEEYTIFTVTYEPDFVSYTVIHYWQNVDNDNYTEHARETIATKYKTGELIENAHKSYPGFYNLLYETPTAAADGSTVIEVYYDRYYYLMKFELDGGYGVEPIYARYGDAAEIAAPMKAGFEFGGWTDAEENAVTIPATVPENGGTYYAKWNPLDTEYTVAYWIRNDDDTETYVGSKIVGAESGSTVSGSDDLTVETNTCGMPEHSHDSCTKTCPLDEHTHSLESCPLDCTHGHMLDCYEYKGFSAGNASEQDRAAIANIGNGEPEDGYIYVINTGSYNYWPKLYLSGKYYVVNNGNGVQANVVSAIVDGKAIAVGTYQSGNTKYTATKYKAKLNCVCHSEDCIACDITEHTHSADCFSCGIVEHTHTASCKTDLAKYVDFVEADQEVEVNGDGSTVVNVYYEYRTYTIRFIYAKKYGNGFQIATLTRDGRLDNCQWTSGGTSLPSFTDPSGITERSTVEIDGSTYYYISLKAKFGDDISAIWPSANIGNAGNYKWGSWAAAPGTGYRIKYGDDHANIVGPYPVMSADLIVDNPEKLADGTYLAQNMIAWWGGNNAGIEAHAYHNYFELLPSEDKTNAVEYNGKYYKLVQTYTFTAAHNGDTRVDPITFNGFKCVNDTRTDSDPNSDNQEDSKNYANDEKCTICGSACSYCNNFYYDRNMHKLYFWNYNGPLMKGTGSDVQYGASLVKHGEYVSNTYMKDHYPEGLEPGAFKFEGWYTTAGCYDGTEMDWATTMPDADFTVYAKWAPVTHSVKYFLTRESLERDENIPAEMDRLVQEAIKDGVISTPPENPYSVTFAEDAVQHGAYIEDLRDPGVADGYEKIHPRAGYDFVGWFYLNDDGEETAFDPANMPVHQDLQLYAKWSSNVLCRYNVYFVLDADEDGVADTDTDGSIVYVADPISGSAIAGRTYTFTAKGGEDLYDPDGDVNYQQGYFPTVGSHSIVIDIQDEAGTGANSFTFLYRLRAAVPYTVKYLEAGTDKVLREQKYVADNKNVVVTENFVYITGYMPDAYQKTLVVTDDNDTSNDVIIFYYAEDTEHALYVVNYYIQDLNDDLTHKGWSRYTSLQSQGDIGTSYSADAITIDGFTLSQSDTDDYNVTQEKNGMDGTNLPAEVGALTGEKLTGTLTNKGLELNFYYTRNLYPYEFRYMLNGTTIKLAETECGKAGYDTVVSMGAKKIVMDLDNDGVNEDYRLYDPTETSKDIHIIKDGEPLTADTAVSEGQATVNVATFYYVRCTQTMTITKEVEDRSAVDDPDPNREYTIRLLIHATSGYHRNSYAYTKTGGETGTLERVPSAPNTLQFTLKNGETITIEGLPTAEYTVSELDLPLGYYDTYSPKQRNKLTVDDQLNVKVTNTYDPAALVISKTVAEVEASNTPMVSDFKFTVTFPQNVTLEQQYAYTLTRNGVSEEKTVNLAAGQAILELKNGDVVRFGNLPLGEYTVEENNYESEGYNTYYSINAGTQTEGQAAKVTLARGNEVSVNYRNLFPVGDLQIAKTVTKEFHGTAWTGATFRFTVVRNNKGLIPGNQYTLLLGTTELAEKATVNESGNLIVTISFDEAEAAQLNQAGAAITKTLTIKDLPLGTYIVTEDTNAEYDQSQTQKTGLELINKPVAEFTNKVKLPRGSLYLAKELIPEEGYSEEELDKEQEFTFTIQLQDQCPDTVTVQVSLNDKEATSMQLTNGMLTLKLKAEERITVTGLPVGTYRITEATLPHYANKFALGNSGEGPWSDLEVQSTADGSLYTDVAIQKDSQAFIKCTNVYPVDVADLILHKKVTQAQAGDPADKEFTFTVVLENADREHYVYQLYDGNGKAIGDKQSAAVADKTLSISLKNGQYARIHNLNAGGCTVTETTDPLYNTGYRVYLYGVDVEVPMPPDTTGMEAQVSGSGTAITRTLAAGTTELMIFENQRRINITYVSNYPAEAGQTEETAIDEKTYNVDYAIKDAAIGETTFEWKGYAIDSWNTEPNGTGTKYEIGGVYKDNTDLTLYAQWVDARLSVPIVVGINMQFYKNGDDFYYSFPVEGETGEPVKTNVDAVRVYIDAQDGNTWKISTQNPYDDPIYGSTNRWGRPLPGNAADYIKSSIFTAEGYTEQPPHCPGLFDSTGVKTKAQLYFTDTDYTGIIQAWITEMTWLSEKYPHTNVDWKSLSTKASDYDVIPYVIKKHENGSLASAEHPPENKEAWHVDVIIVPKAKYKVTYKLNLEEGYTADTPTDPNQYGKGFVANVKTFHNVVHENDSNRIAKFKGWHYDANKNGIIDEGEIYAGGSKLVIPAENVTLVAQWEYPVEYTVEYYKKDPITGAYVCQTADTQVKPAYISQGQNAEYEDHKYPGYHFVKVEPTDLKIIQDGQLYKVYYDPNTLTISQSGLGTQESAIYLVQGEGLSMYVEIQGVDSVTIEQIPTGEYTVTELKDWTWKYNSDADSTASAKSVTVTAEGPNQVSFAFTSNDPDWLGGENAKNNKFASKPVLQP